MDQYEEFECIKVSLNEVEQELAINVAKKRFENNREKGNPNEKIGDQSDWATDLEGIAAEIAWCKVYNAYPDLTVDGEKNPYYDAITSDGRTVDVKGTVHEHGKLAVRLEKAEKEERPDVYALVIGTFPNYRIAGHYDSDKLFNPDNIGTLGYGPTYLKSQPYLRKDP